MFRRDPYAAKCFRAVQGARVSRWIRDSEIGWIFYGPGDRAYHLLSEEAESLEKQGRALIERAIDGGFVPAGLVRGLVALAILAGLAVTVATAGMLQYVSGAAAFALGVGAFLVGALGNDIGYERALRRWRREAADVLERNARGGVPQAVATHHRHYNLWQSICVGCVALLACRFAWTEFIARSGPGDLGWVDAALLAVAVLTAWPAQRVDAFHRRRKWFD